MPEDKIDAIVHMKTYFNGLGLETDGKILEALVKAAMLDPVEEIRQNAVDDLNKIYGGLIKRGYEARGKLLIDVVKEEKMKVFYICDVPKKYIREPTEVHPFDLTLEQQVPSDSGVNLDRIVSRTVN